VLQYLAELWSYDVSLAEIDGHGKVLKEYVLSPRAVAAAA
jgi:stage V sporulation protein R